MTYKDVLTELDEVNLKERFASEYEGFINDVLLAKVKKTNKIASVGSLIRSLMIFYVNESKEWLFWQKALVYFMTPKFARKISETSISSLVIEKELANWIYYEDDDIFYCSKCIEDRLQEIKEKDEFIDELGDDECGFYKDYSHHKEEVTCCKCLKPLFYLADL